MQAIYKRPKRRFKAVVYVTATPGATVTATSGTYTESCVVTSTGVGTLELSRKGTYSLQTSDGVTGSVTITAGGEYYTNLGFLAAITGTCNSRSLVTATGPGVYSTRADAAGAFNLMVRRPGRYTVTTDSGAGASVSVTENGSTVGPLELEFEKTMAIEHTPRVYITVLKDGNKIYAFDGDADGVTEKVLDTAGRYTIKTGDGVTAETDVTWHTADSFYVDARWKATVDVTATPGDYVWYYKDGLTTEGVTADGTGHALVTVPEAGTWKFRDEHGLTGSITITEQAAYSITLR